MGWKLVNLQIKHNRKLQISFFSVLMSINSCKEISIYEVKICLICTNDCKSFWMIAWADWKWLKISQFFLMKWYSSYRFSYYKKRLNVLLSLVNYDFVFLYLWAQQFHKVQYNIDSTYSYFIFLYCWSQKAIRNFFSVRNGNLPFAPFHV